MWDALGCRWSRDLGATGQEAAMAKPRIPLQNQSRPRLVQSSAPNTAHFHQALLEQVVFACAEIQQDPLAHLPTD